MNNSPDDAFAMATPEQKYSALFRNMIAQQANTALMLMGKIPHPESGQMIQDQEASQFFVDQLEMLAAKTKGNLDATEEDLMHRSLTLLRMAFVESFGGPPSADPIPVMESPQPQEKPTPSFLHKDSPPPSPESPSLRESVASHKPTESTATLGSDDEPRKRFSKKY